MTIIFLWLTLSIGVQAPPADALAGTWKANVTQSQRDANHRFSEMTARFDVSSEGVTLVYGGINKAGHPESSSVLYRPDGKDYPTPQAPGVITSSTRTARQLEVWGKKDGQVVGHATYEVSADGTTLTATVSGIDASGRAFEQVIVFDREKRP